VIAAQVKITTAPTLREGGCDRQLIYVAIHLSIIIFQPETFKKKFSSYNKNKKPVLTELTLEKKNIDAKRH